MSFCTRLLFVFVTLFVVVAAPARACEPMSSTSFSAQSHHPAVLTVADVDAAAGSIEVQAPANAGTSCGSGCLDCVACAHLCVGSVSTPTQPWVTTSTLGLPVWTAEPMASRFAAPELKPPRL